MFLSPESCPKHGDVAGNLNVIAKVLRTLSYDDLKEVESKIMSRLNSQQEVNMKKTLKHLFYGLFTFFVYFFTEFVYIFCTLE